MFDRDRYVAVWEDWRSYKTQGINLYSRILVKGPSPLARHSEQAITTARPASTLQWDTARRDAPHVVASPHHPGYYVGNCVGYRAIEFHRLDENATPIGESVMVENADSSEDLMKCFPRVMAPSSDTPPWIVFHQMSRAVPARSSLRYVRLTEEGHRNPDYEYPSEPVVAGPEIGTADMIARNGDVTVLWRVGGVTTRDRASWTPMVSNTYFFSAPWQNDGTLGSAALRHQVPGYTGKVPPIHRFYPTQIAATRCSMSTVVPTLDAPNPRAILHIPAMGIIQRS